MSTETQKADVLAAVDARIARINDAITNDAAALVPANYRAGVEKIRRDELESMTAARAAVAEFLAAFDDAASEGFMAGPALDRLITARERMGGV